KKSILVLIALKALREYIYRFLELFEIRRPLVVWLFQFIFSSQNLSDSGYQVLNVFLYSRIHFISLQRNSATLLTISFINANLRTNKSLLQDYADLKKEFFTRCGNIDK